MSSHYFQSVGIKTGFTFFFFSLSSFTSSYYSSCKWNGLSVKRCMFFFRCLKNVCTKKKSKKNKKKFKRKREMRWDGLRDAMGLNFDQSKSRAWCTYICEVLYMDYTKYTRLRQIRRRRRLLSGFFFNKFLYIFLF